MPTNPVLRVTIDGENIGITGNIGINGDLNVGGNEKVFGSLTVLGAIHGTISGQSANPLDYNFTPIAPGGTLTGGSAASVSIPLGPAGLAGSDTHHYVYISGGTGSAEAVLITGGTVTPGNTGTLQFTPANSHSGGWTISSASMGLQEALNVNPNVFIPNVNTGIVLLATVTPPADATIQGSNEGAAAIIWSGPNNAEVFHVINDRFTMVNLRGLTTVTGVSGNVFVRAYGPLAVTPGNCAYGRIQNVFINGTFFNGVVVEGNGQLFNVYNLQIASCISDGIIGSGAQGFWSDITSENGQGNGVTLNSTAGFGGSIIFMSNIQTYNNRGWGIVCNTILLLSGGGTYLNNDYQGELLLNFSLADVGYLCDATIQFAGQTVTWGTNNTAPGVLIQTGTGPFVLQNCHFFNSQGNAVSGSSSKLRIINCTFVGSGQGAQANNVYDIFTGSANQLVCMSNQLSRGAIFNGNNMVIVGNTVIVSQSGVFAVDISGGLDLILDDNEIVNGAGPALGINTGVTYLAGCKNIVNGTSSSTNGGSASSHSMTLT